MKKIIDMVQYTNLIPRVKFQTKNMRDSFAIVYLSENSMFIEDYESLNIRINEVRNIFIPRTTIPRFMLDGKTKLQYKSLGLRPFTTGMSIPKNKNIFVDMTQYTNLIDSKFNPQNYRVRAGAYIKNELFNMFRMFPKNYFRVLLYTVNLDKEVPVFTDRKIYPLLKQLKEGEFQYEYFLLGVIKDGKIRYRLLVKNKDFQFARVLSYIKQVHAMNSEEEIDNEVDKATDEITKTPEVDELKTSTENKEKISQFTKEYLKIDKDKIEEIENSKKYSPEEKMRIIATSILYRVNGDSKKAKNIINAIPNKDLPRALKALEKTFLDELLVSEKPLNKSNDEVLKLLDIPKAVDYKYPGHLFEKRKVDFEKNLKLDMKNAFKTLQKKEIPLKLSSINIESKPQRKGELMKSDISLIQAKLTDDFGNTHNISLEIPTIDPKSGAFKINGQRKCLVNQIILSPLTFPKKFDSKFESSYSSFHIWSKRTKRLQYLEVYMGSYKLPFFVLLCFSFGFEQTMKKYKVDYELTTEKSKDYYSIKINDSTYLVIKNHDETEMIFELVESLRIAKIDEYNINKNINDEMFFTDLIIAMTGRINSTYLIGSNLENIVDPVVKQILINMNLPYELEDIMYYMASKVVEGFLQDRNDLGNQRIRGSEVIVSLAQSMILGAYTEYKEQVLSGNKNAEFKIVGSKLLSDFINSQIVVGMEYANPVEEMSTMTRVSPVGKNIGGIPDRRAVQGKALNVHPSYFGNIDPLDTPEGGNIGVVQQLAIGASVTSARGLFNIKEMNNNEKSGILSSTSSQCPFIEHNDGPRMIMFANQAKQMLPLKDPESPIVASGYESLLSGVLSDNFIKKSSCVGKVTNITEIYIEITCINGSKEKIDITPRHLRSGSGKDTLSIFKLKVKKGDLVKKDMIIAEGACIADGSIALGRTLLVGIMDYRGFTFEDGIVINEDVGKKLTSLHGIVEEMLIEESDRIINIIPIGTKTKKGDVLLIKTIGELEQLLGFDEDEDESLLQQGQILIKKSPGGTIVDIEVFSNIKTDSSLTPIPELVKRNDWQNIRKDLVGTWNKNPKENIKILRKWIGDFKNNDLDKLRIVMNYLTGTAFRIGKITHPDIQKLRDDISKSMKDVKNAGIEHLINKTDKKYGMKTSDKYSHRGTTIKGTLIKFIIEQELVTGEGDKLSNRSGNKGIISKVLPANKMPKTPWGEPLDIIIRPLGITSRQNVGQILEVYTGLISKELGNQISKMSKKEDVIKLLKKVIPLLDKSGDLASSLFAKLTKMKSGEFNKFLNSIKKSGFFPIVIPPFQSPGYKRIYEAMKAIGLKSKYTLSLPEYGNIKTVNSVPLGYVYISKLEHIGDEKIHSRSTGPKVAKTGQPTGGKSREGGQRLGEGETYALLSYNCPTVLSEFFGALSDDSASKDEMMSEILQKGRTSYKEAKMSPTKDLLNAYFKGMGLQRN
jgi:DNA-directed RNA polymerase beta subunit